MQDCNWLDAMDVNPDLGAIQDILRSTKVLPLDTNKKATIILPNLPGGWPCTILRLYLVSGTAGAPLVQLTEAMWALLSTRCHQTPG